MVMNDFLKQSWRIIAAQGLSQVCDRMMLLGVIWVITTSNRAEWSAWFLAFGALPHLLMYFWTPRLIQKWDALRLILFSDLARGIILIFSSVLFLGPWEDWWLVVLFILSFGINTFAALFNPAILVLPTRISSNSEITKRMTAAVESCFAFSGVVAPLISIAVYHAIGLAGLILVNGLSYLLAWWIEKGISPFKTQDSPSQESQKEIVTIRSINQRAPVIVAMLAGFLLLNLCLGPLLVLIPLYAVNIYHGTLKTVGSLEMALALGTLAGGIFLSVFQKGSVTLKKIFFCLILNSIFYFLFTLMPQHQLGLLSLFLLGFALATANVFIIQFFQSLSLPSELPVVMNAVNVIGVATLPLSLAVFGFVIQSYPESLMRIANVASGLSLILVISLGAILLLRKARYHLQHEMIDSGSSTKFEVNKARISDVTDLMHLYHVVYGDSYPVIYGTNPQAAKELISSESGFWFVIRDPSSGSPIASVIVIVDEEVQVGEVIGLVVHPQWANKGFATTLVEQAVDDVFHSAIAPNSIYATTRTVSLGPQKVFIKNQFCALGIFPNSHMLKKIETLSFFVRYRPGVLSKRQVLPRLHKDLEELFNLAEKNINHHLVEKPLFTNFFATDEILEISGRVEVKFEMIDDPEFVYDQFSEVIPNSYDRYYPFHKPNFLARSTDGKIMVFMHVNHKDRYCAVIAANVSWYQMKQQLSDLFLNLKWNGISYVECMIRLDSFESVQAMLDFRFIPSALYPAMLSSEDGTMLDYVLLSQSLEPLTFEGVNLTDDFKPYLDQYLHLLNNQSLSKSEVFHANS